MKPSPLRAPVPAHRRRVAWRGLDHARILATVVAAQLDGELAIGVLQRTRATTPQVGLDPEARRRNVVGAFAAHGELAGRRVILVDDLIATGGTATAAVQLLRRMGADVVAAVFVIDLPELGGADKLRALDVPVRTLISFDGH